MRPTPEPDLDVDVLAAESRLERIDDERLGDDHADTDQPDESEPDLLVRRAASTEEGMHLLDPDAVDTAIDDDDEPSLPSDATIDAFIERFNARDLDGLTDLLADDVETPGLGNDLANFEEAVEMLWERSPTCLLTRGLLAERPVAVVWEGADGRWWKDAVLQFDAEVDDGTDIGLVEFVDDPDSFDGVECEEPEREFLEGSRWEEWDEGVES